MAETHVVTCFLRNRAAVLLVRRSDAVGSYSGQWGAVAGHVAPDPDDGPHATDTDEGDDPDDDTAASDAAAHNPDAAARREIAEETGLEDAVTLVRRGDPFPVADDDHDTRWLVHPYLFDCDSRDVRLDEEASASEWVPPTEILRRGTVPDLWTSYDRVRPGVDTVADDRKPAAVERAAEVAITDALDADDAAAATAAETVDGDCLVTLSRSGTVREALRRADPEGVLVAESRPGGEGVGVAESLAVDGTAVTLAPDAALAHELAGGDHDAVLVGADAVLPDGRVVNKVGTRAVALAATREGVPLFVVAAAAKVSTDPDPHLEPGDPTDVYDGDATIDVAAPLFDVTPPDLVAGYCTERGVLDADDVAAVAAAHRERAEW